MARSTTEQRNISGLTVQGRKLVAENPAAYRHVHPLATIGRCSACSSCRWPSSSAASCRPAARSPPPLKKKLIFLGYMVHVIGRSSWASRSNHQGHGAGSRAISEPAQKYWWNWCTSLLPLHPSGHPHGRTQRRHQPDICLGVCSAGSANTWILGLQLLLALVARTGQGCAGLMNSAIMSGNHSRFSAWIYRVRADLVPRWFR